MPSELPLPGNPASPAPPPDRPAGLVRVAVLTGGGDKPYALGLASSLIEQGVAFDFIGSDEVDCPELHTNPLVRFLNLWGNQSPRVSVVAKVVRTLKYYARLLVYAAGAKPRVFHILWNNKFEYLDRTLLLLYYRLLGKRVVFTAHNVNIRQRDGNDSLVNRLTLRFQYRLFSHIFVHTAKMKRELIDDFGVPDSKSTIIPFGLNSTVPNTSLTPADARRQLGFAASDRILLFFGNITAYKGLEYLVEALVLLAPTEPRYRLVIAGRTKGRLQYWETIRERITRTGLDSIVTQRIEFVPDEDTEIYFKAADALVLPYTQIFQSGVLFVGYNFGLPVIASDVGALREDIVDGETGFVCKPQDPADLAATISRYFNSDLYAQLGAKRPEIQDYARRRYSWTTVGEITLDVYRKLMAG